MNKKVIHKKGNKDDELMVRMMKETRALIHNTLIESLENAKAYHQKENDRYIGALMEEWRSESRAFHDYMRGIKDTVDDHEHRLVKLEA